MDFEYESPGWSATGQEPGDLKSTGWQPNQKPPAGIFNWFWTRVSNCITEIQTKLANHQHPVADVTGVLPISKGGTGANAAADALAALGGLSKPIEVTSGTHNLNTYTQTGFWFFSQGATLTNQPASAVNGWLLVTRSSTGIAKQYWSRQGSSGTYQQMYVRLANSSSADTTWCDWAKIYTSLDKVASASVADALSTARTIRTNLASTSTASFDGSANVTPGVSGVLSAANGGTGQSSLKNSANALINALETGSSAPHDNDYFISQYQDGGTTNTTYYRRKVSALWTYIKSKTDSLYAEAAHNHSANNITSGTLSIARGGTGASSASSARTNIGAQAAVTADLHTATDILAASGVGTLSNGSIRLLGDKWLDGILNFSSFSTDAYGKAELATFKSAYRCGISHTVTGYVRKSGSNIEIPVTGMIDSDGKIVIRTGQASTNYSTASIVFYCYYK